MTPIRPICEKYRATETQIAIVWLLHRSPFMLPIPGTTRLEHFEENFEAETISLTEDEVNDITQIVSENKD